MLIYIYKISILVVIFVLPRLKLQIEILHLVLWHSARTVSFIIIVTKFIFRISDNTKV